MQCLRCGSPATAGSRFCANCGSMLSDPGAETARISAATAQVDPLLATLRGALSDEYEIARELGRGGMAIVFAATERALERPVALKVLPPEMAAMPSIAERFKREARMAAAMSHPNIIDVYRVGQAKGVSYIAMRYIEGRPLDSILESQGALPIPALLVVLRAAVSALAYAHDHGVIHRDIKGGNILVDRDGRVTVSDFGIARAVEEAGLTQSGAIIGTPYFMAPEQCAGLPLGPQCDQYAMGVVAFQMLTGAVPFTADSVIGIMHHHFSTPVPDVNTIRAGVPAQLIDVVGRALAKRAEDRFPTTHDMLHAVEAVPFSDADRREGEALLRELARGAAVSKVPTGQVTTPPPSIPSMAPAAQSGGASVLFGGGAVGVATPLPPAGGPGAATPVTPVPASTPPASWALPATTPSAATPPAGRVPTPPMASPEVTPPAVPPVRVAPRQAPPSRSWIGWLFGLAALLLVAAVGVRVYRARTGPEAQMRRAARLYQAGRAEAARGWYEKVAAEHPEMVEPHLFLARIARDQRDLPTARRELERALVLRPRDATALREMGSVLFAQGSYELARRFYVRALQSAPTDRSTQGFLGCTLVRLGRVDEGARFVQRAGPGPWDGCVAGAERP